MTIVEHYRKMLNVQRLSGTVKMRSYNLAEHSFGVVSLFLTLCEREGIGVTSEVIQLVLFHDLAETVTGDLLYPVKNQNSVTKYSWSAIEAEVLDKHPVVSSFTDSNIEEHLDEKQLAAFKAADILELLLFCYEEVSVGNKNPDLLKVIFTCEGLLKGSLYLESAVNIMDDEYRRLNLEIGEERRYYVGS